MPARFRFLSVTSKPSGWIKCSRLRVTAHIRPMLPVFCGICGWNSTTCSMGSLDETIRFTASRIPLESACRPGPGITPHAMAISPSRNGDKIVVLVDDEFSYIDLLQQLLADHLACPVHGFTKPAD